MCSLKTLLSQKSSKSPKINEILHLKRFRRGIRASLIARAERFDSEAVGLVLLDSEVFDLESSLPDYAYINFGCIKYF